MKAPVFYLGGGLFNNFWERDQPFTLTSKCVEIHHWQHGLRVDAQGKGYIDEERVKTLARQTLADPDATAAVLARMMRIRDPQGVYEEGGCIDATRERVRWVTPGHSDISLPDFPRPRRPVWPERQRASMPASKCGPQGRPIFHSSQTRSAPSAISLARLRCSVCVSRPSSA